MNTQSNLLGRQRKINQRNSWQLMFPLVACASLLVILTSTTLAQSVHEHDYLNWSQDSCKKILKKHTRNISIADFHWGTAIMGGMGTIVEGEKDYFVWLTDPAAKAYARLIQLRTRLSDSEAVQVYRKLRPPGTARISLVMFSRSQELGWKALAGVTIDEGEKPDAPGNNQIDLRRTLFLVNKNDKEQGARVEEILDLPDQIIVPTVSNFDSAFGSLLRFRQITQDGTPLVTSLKDQVIVSFYRLGKEHKTTFKVKDFRISGLDQL